MIKGIIFDFGGVLMRTEDTSPRRAWEDRLKLAPGSVERAVHHSDLWVQAQLGRVTPRRYWEGVAEMLYMRNDDIAELKQDYFSGDRVNYRLVELIGDLKAAGYGVVLLSNDSIELEPKLRAHHLYDLFDAVHISANIGVMKPDRTAYRVALQSLGAQPAEAIFVDDSLTNIRGAQALGIHTIHFRGDTDVRAAIKKITEAGDS